MKKYFFLGLLIFIGAMQLSAQNDLLNILDSIAPPPKHDKVTAAFKTTRLTNLQTTQTVGKGILDFRITHRFSNAGVSSNGGVHTLYGLDALSDVRFSFDYGITRKLQVGIGRSRQMENLDGSLKWKILEQTTDNTIPLSITAYEIASLTPEKESQLYTGTDSAWIQSNKTILNRLTYTSQIILSSKIGRLTLVVAPTFNHRNYVLRQTNTIGHGRHTSVVEDETNIPALGMGFRFKLTRSFSIIADYFYVISSYRKNNSTHPYYNPVSIGVEIETGGHVFHINFTNASGIIENYFIPISPDSWVKGGFKFGFDISRGFSLGKKAEKSKPW
jgi:hypothetical protein